MTPGDLQDSLPGLELTLAMRSEHLAGLLVKVFRSIAGKGEKRTLQASTELDHISCEWLAEAFATVYEGRASQALWEAWASLERTGIVVRSVSADHSTNYFFSRRAESFELCDDVSSYQSRSALPRELLHPEIVEQVWPAFLQGNYQKSISQAFGRIEAEVHQAGAFADDQYGLSLIRGAYAPRVGVLCDWLKPRMEQKATYQLFAGAFGKFQSGRMARMDAREAFEVLIVASHLMRIVWDGIQSRRAAVLAAAELP